MTVPDLDPPGIVLSARKYMKLSQTVFGEKYGYAQSAVSKYEKGRVPVPASLVLECMKILEVAPTREIEISSHEVAKLIESCLQGPQFSRLRAVLADLIKSLSAVPGSLPVGGANEGLVSGQ